MKGLVSVIVPVFNAEKFIVRCIESLLKQTYNNIEIMICDDCSNDKSWQILNTKFSDSRIRLFRNEENRGVVFTRNLLLQESNGEYIAFQDADDFSRNDRLEIQINFLKIDTECFGCGCQFVKIHDDKQIYISQFHTDYEHIKSKIPSHFEYLPATVMMRKSILKEYGYFNPFFGNDGNEDIYFLSRIILNHKFVNINQTTYYYTLNINSLTKLQTQNKRKLYINEVTFKLLNQYKERKTNYLEENKIEQLNLLESTISAKYNHLNSFDFFENTIGQLLYYNLKLKCVKLIFKYGLRISVYRSIRLFIYIAFR